jgi:hypothetical protein
MKKQLIVTTAVLFISLGVSAGTLKGTVTDEKDAPMAGVEVSVWGKENVKGKTDARGQFKLTSDELVPGNRYAVKAELEGYMMAQTSFGTEMYEDEEDMEPLEIVMRKEEIEPETETVENKDPSLAGRGDVTVTEDEGDDSSDEEEAEEAKPAAETKPAETKPAETKPAETKPAETKPAETKPAETKPAETKPAETKPAETKPAETKPAETKPAETKPAETKPAEAKAEETKPAEK